MAATLAEMLGRLGEGVEARGYVEGGGFREEQEQAREELARQRTTVNAMAMTFAQMLARLGAEQEARDEDKPPPGLMTATSASGRVGFVNDIASSSSTAMQGREFVDAARLDAAESSNAGGSSEGNEFVDVEAEVRPRL